MAVGWSALNSNLNAMRFGLFGENGMIDVDAPGVVGAVWSPSWLDSIGGFYERGFNKYGSHDCSFRCQSQITSKLNRSNLTNGFQCKDDAETPVGKTMQRFGELTADG